MIFYHMIIPQYNYIVMLYCHIILFIFIPDLDKLYFILYISNESEVIKMSNIATMIYHLIEQIDGEKHKRLKLIPYPTAQKIKLLCLEVI